MISISAWKYFQVDLLVDFFYTFKLTFISARRHFRLTCLVDFHLYILVDCHIRVLVDSLADFVPYILVDSRISHEILSSWHIRLTFLVDFLLYIPVDLFYQLVWLTFWLTINWLTLLHNLVDLRISQEILSSFLRD